MHGDFKNHNIVFKEDDYLNYQYNFPLIENYIKSILSTHTILFLGYSYNDVNFKQIMKWLQNYSTVQPPRYLTVFSENTTQNKYLENHGVTVFNLDDTNGEVTPDYFGKTQSFLSLIKGDKQLDLIKNEIDIIDFVLERLKPLIGLNGILLEQIQSSLTNCGYVYDDDNKVILEFYKNVQTYDYNEERRDIYRAFVDILKKQDEKEIKNNSIVGIFEILNNAGIKGVMVSDDDSINRNKSYIAIGNYISDASSSVDSAYFEFNTIHNHKEGSDAYELLNSAFLFYQNQNYDNAFEFIEKTISLCLKQKNYTILFISMFNKNVLLRRLKSGAHENGDSYKDVEEYDLDDKFNELPKDLKKVLRPIYDFINFHYLYQYSFKVSEELREKEESKDTIASGGFVFSSNVTKSSSNHRNLISFVLRNGIMIEGYREFRRVNKYLLNIAIIRQVQKEKTTFNSLEIFSSIKYLSNKELKNLLVDFYKSESELKGKFDISDVDKEQLISTSLINIVDRYIDSKNSFDESERYLQNLIFLLSLTKHTDDHLSSILIVIDKVIDKGRNTIDIYRSINLFLGNQYGLYNTKISEESLLNLITVMINKFVTKKYSFYDFHAITRNEVSNLYGYAREENVVFKDAQLARKLIIASKELPVGDQLNLSESLLLIIYDLSF